MTGIEKEIIEKIKIMPPESQKIILEMVINFEKKQEKPKRLSTLEKIDEIVASKPEDIWSEVPNDSAEKVDEYLYGVKK